ncbi:MAG: type VI secretion system Vgr family protein [Acidobacteriota bacterium]
MPAEQPHFTFTLSSLDPGTFHVVRFTGTEGLSRLYQFDLTLLSENASVDFGKALSGTATFTIKRPEGGDLVWHGILRDFQQLHMADRHVFYRAALVPKAWQLTLTQHNQIFLNQDITQNISQCLADGGLSQGLDFELNASHTYPKREYVCQYNETHFNFVSRWMERNGFYFFFDQSGQQEKLSITDSLNVHNPHPGGDTLIYAEPSGLDADITGKAAKNFYCEQRRLPREVLLRDYNYQTPSLDIQGKALVSKTGSGTMYTHGGHLRTVTEAEALARLRAQGFKCREQVFFGESNAPFLQPGYVATLEKHYRDDFNRKYLLIEVKHEGAQESWLTAGMGATGLGDRLFYRNAFAAIPADVQFRAEQKTPRPLIDGALKAVIDAEGTGQYAELDDQGRYKVIMPFDLSGRKEGHASTWLRMIQPYAGQNHGMHFPLHKGTEVAIIHYEGNPDRPVIAGAVPNPETPSMVTSGNQTMANFTSAGGNLIHVQDQQGSERILLHSTAKGDFIRIGAHNDPPSFSDTVSEFFNDGINLTTPQWFNVKAEFANQLVLGDNTQTTLGVYSCNAIGANITFIVGMSITTNCAMHTEFAPIWKEMRASVQQAAAQKDTVYANLIQTVGQHTNTIGQHTVTIGQHDQTIGQHTVTIGQHTNTIGQHGQTIGQHTVTIGQHDQTIGQHTITIGQHDQTIGQHTLTIGQHDQTIGQHTVTIGELEQNAGEITSMAADVSNLWGVVSVVAGEVGFV